MIKISPGAQFTHVSRRLNLDTEELQEAKRVEIREWLDTHPYEETWDVQVIYKKIYEDKEIDDKGGSDTRRSNLIYTGDTLFDQMKEDLLMPHLTKWDNGRPMMRTLVKFFMLMKLELGYRHPELNTLDKNRFQRWFESLQSSLTIPREPEKEQESKLEGIYKNVDLKSPAHQLVCEELERRKIMFMWEVNTVLPGDTKSYRRIDLVVIQNFRAVIVEIDGKSHRSQQKYQDDANRDRLIGDHWNNQIRLEYGEVMDDFRENEGEVVMRKILSRLDPNNGLIR